MIHVIDVTNKLKNMNPHNEKCKIKEKTPNGVFKNKYFLVIYFGFGAVFKQLLSIYFLE